MFRVLLSLQPRLRFCYQALKDRREAEKEAAEKEEEEKEEKEEAEPTSL